MICGMCRECPFVGRDIPNDLYEIHITVDLSSGIDAVESWNIICKEEGIKIIIIEFDSNSTGAALQHPMTSSTHRFKEPRESLLHANLLAQKFRDAGIRVDRIKIETTLTNDSYSHSSYEGSYYEAHIPVTVPTNLNRLHLLDFIKSIDMDFHVSQNPYKMDNLTKTIFATIRGNPKNMSAKCFDSMVHHYANQISVKYPTGDIRTELAIYDTNLSLDKDWI